MMATNKNATIRYQVLDRCFRNPGRRYYMEDLVDACNEAHIDPDSSGVKRRQVFDDITFMRDSRGFSAPIESFKDGKNPLLIIILDCKITIEQCGCIFRNKQCGRPLLVEK